ncbi:LamG-like jellyroll fold domain-containing protein [Rubellicoccus peritrichatus]|uniref:LamG-like jellyroll fold domain-containing protein n=1 Tax=Rubellicoccus peritrichatus TaxID=3080537 RepID=A0AAQ3QV11_9BACT|nr:LamG-like jellyroll fold domain-containing protein [Puniceicoccus sp. CR14]WOO41028.1 LamG-like jellyroll fold domain-containing protein [Puniceicoccus sp. CR14]
MLYHFDEASGAFENSGTEGSSFNLDNTGGATGRSGTTGGVYGASAFVGFGNALDILASGNGNFNSSTAINGGGVFASSSTSATQADYQASNGAFTWEAMVKLDVLNQLQMILSRDNNTSNRGPSIFINNDINFFGFETDIPTTGEHAFVAGEWFHVAVTYNGQEGEADNLKLYWTRVDEQLTEANLLGSFTAASDYDAGSTGELMIGSHGRGEFRSEIRYIDEVRISDIARTADDFIFGEAQPANTSALVYPGSDGRLVYGRYANEDQTLESNRMIDFSHAGYMGGGVAIPMVPVVRTLNPNPSGDDFKRIQTAIDEVAAMPLSSAGFRGAILLTAGDYRVSETLKIADSGIIIRGEGQGADDTVITLTATTQDILFEFKGPYNWSKVSGSETPIVDEFVPAGATSFEVGSTVGLSVGDEILVHKIPNQAWIDLLDMYASSWPDAPVPPHRDWVPEEYDVEYPRVITKIVGNRITINTPLVHAIETQYGGGEIYRYTNNGSIHHVGIERIRLDSTYTSSTDENHGWDAVVFWRVVNGWARQVTARHYAFSCVKVFKQSYNVTVEDCAMIDPISVITGGRRYSFVADEGSLVLFQRCYTREGRHDYVTQARTLGPTAFVDCLAEVVHSDIGPHHRYSEGILFDNVKGGEIAVQNRGSSGTGHGWSGAQVVFWNCNGTQIRCDAPKGAMNFAIGCIGQKVQGNSFTYTNEPYGIWESENQHVTPRSLYYKQLEDRLGTLAMLTITNQAQLNGNLWSTLSSWQGNGAAPGAPDFTPVQVDTGPDRFAAIDEVLTLNAVIRQPLPSNFPMTITGWTQLSGPANAVITHTLSQSTAAIFPVLGTYVLQFEASQTDDSGPGAPLVYQDTDTVSILVTSDGSSLNPSIYASLGTIASGTAALTFDTDTLALTGGLAATGQIGLNQDNSEVAVFNFENIDLTASPTVTGNRPLILMSQGDLRLATSINVNGGVGGHTVHGVGVAGGQDGGDSNRSETPGNPTDGQGPGASLFSTGSSGGAGYGGAGGAGTGSGGTSYGDAMLTNILGGSGAGGNSNKGGGAGGGALALIAIGDVEITSSGSLSANGGVGAGSTGGQITSGGGSGGSIFISGNAVTINGSVTANGGNGGNGVIGQTNAGAGGGGRIAIYYESFLDTTDSTITTNGGLPQGTDTTGQPGSAGTIYYNFEPNIATEWLINETGNSSPTPSDWLLDNDSNGLSLRVEFAMGLTPSEYVSGMLPVFIFDGPGENYLRFNRRQSGINAEDYEIQTATSLTSQTWDLIFPDESKTVPHPTLSGFEHVFVPLSLDAPTRFFRVEVK